VLGIARCRHVSRKVAEIAECAVLFRKNERSGRRVASDGVDQGGSLTFLRDSKFFFTLYQAGKVNIILHAVSFYFCSMD
jgi:hypothetical protein